MENRAMSEAEIQTAIVNHFRRTYAGLIAHVPNGGLRGKLAAIRFRAIGVLAGVPDLLIWSPKGHFLMEVKTTKGALSNTQWSFHNDIRDMGFDVAVVHGVEEGKAALAAWGLPRKTQRVRSAAEISTGL